MAKVFHYDLYGKRDFKYKFLEDNLKNLKWEKLKIETPYYFFVPKNFGLQDKYEKGFKVDNLFINNNTGIQTKCDELSIHFDINSLEKVVSDFKNLSIDDLKKVYHNKTDSSGWNFKDASNDLKTNKIYFTNILYRPFDIRHTLYTGKSSGFIGRPRTSTMQHMVDKDNIGLITLRINGEGKEYVCLLTNQIIEKGSLPKGNYSLFPLYLYPENNKQQTLDNSSNRIPNLNPEIIKQISESLGLAFTNEKEEGNVCLANDKDVRSEFRTTFAPIDLLDYIYAVLHSPNYRETYKEFLKIDFPRIPIPSDPGKFWQLVKLGGELRQIHLLESPTTEKYITQYPEDGDNIVTKPTYKNGSVYINDTQYFANVPEVAWNFYIGGYQPAQKWLKDRKDRELCFEDILHYQKIIVALSETDRIMKEIDKIEI